MENLSLSFVALGHVILLAFYHFGEALKSEVTTNIFFFLEKVSLVVKRYQKLSSSWYLPTKFK